MRKLFASLSDRLLALVAPRTEALAACDNLPCTRRFCYCAGPGGRRMYEKLCCRTDNGSHCCGPCLDRGFCPL